MMYQQSMAALKSTLEAEKVVISLPENWSLADASVSQERR
jgi:hypothetical protein